MKTLFIAFFVTSTVSAAALAQSASLSIQVKINSKTADAVYRPQTQSIARETAAALKDLLSKRPEFRFWHLTTDPADITFTFSIEEESRSIRLYAVLTNRGKVEDWDAAWIERGKPVVENIPLPKNAPRDLAALFFTRIVEAKAPQILRDGLSLVPLSTIPPAWSTRPRFVILPMRADSTMEVLIGRAVLRIECDYRAGVRLRLYASGSPNWTENYPPGAADSYKAFTAFSLKEIAADRPCAKLKWDDVRVSKPKTVYLDNLHTSDVTSDVPTVCR